jgi:hypothetical protein
MIQQQSRDDGNALHLNVAQGELEQCMLTESALQREILAHKHQ